MKTRDDFFSENKRKIFLKYDGERITNMYSVYVYETPASSILQDAFGKDCKQPIQELKNILSHFDYELNDLIDEIAQLFYDIEEYLIDKFGANVIFGITFNHAIDNSCQELAFLSCSLNNHYYHIENTPLSKILEKLTEVSL